MKNKKEKNNEIRSSNNCIKSREKVENKKNKTEVEEEEEEE